jgi:hypothetical protein
VSHRPERTATSERIVITKTPKQIDLSDNANYNIVVYATINRTVMLLFLCHFEALYLASAVTSRLST